MHACSHVHRLDACNRRVHGRVYKHVYTPIRIDGLISYTFVSRYHTDISALPGHDGYGAPVGAADVRIRVCVRAQGEGGRGRGRGVLGCESL